ncbi:HIT-like protein [Aspergillus sclerotioniger CBS 115572]|uniref:HIT-like protein n=1 Tax=Aspergillus sclerotioniger CBS 115572 TaxID=1450535 RepID=A0A317XBX5_9EURO|nr:HIT-like protein [Aspergillus sclerotioniger CBS 115572]PWY95611.1 HIT-like protein [Aspergillus sclerotioniger CBS 115572]
MADQPTTSIYHDDHLTITLSTQPTTPGHTLAHLTNTTKTPLFSLPKPTYIQTLLKLRTISTTLNKYHRLTSIRNTILTASNLPSTDPATYDYTFHGPAGDTNLFARIIRGELPQWRIWEDEHHVAFLTPFPNTPGFTVLVPRAHLSSDIFALEEGAFERLMRAAYCVGRVLVQAFGLETCGMVFEGFEIDYAHVKLIPVRGDGDGDSGEREVFHETYPGYVSSLPGPSVEDRGELVRMAGEIRRLIAEE